MTRFIIGLPGTLPPDEHIVWQGRPDWRSLARRMLHIRGIALYLAIILAGTAAASLVQGATVAETAFTIAPLAAASLLVIAFLAGLAWLLARSTEYTLTTHRLVMRMGVALPATLSIPHCAIAHAAVTLHRDHTGDLPIATKPAHLIKLRRIWPHARPWHLARPQPMLRSIPQAGQVAALLARTLATAESRTLTPGAIRGRTPAPPPQTAIQHPQAAALSPVG